MYFFTSTLYIEILTIVLTQLIERCAHTLHTRGSGLKTLHPLANIRCVDGVLSNGVMSDLHYPQLGGLFAGIGHGGGFWAAQSTTLLSYL